MWFLIIINWSINIGNKLSEGFTVILGIIKNF